MRDPQLAPSQDARLARVWERMRELYHAGKVPNRLYHLTTSMFKGSAEEHLIWKAKVAETRRSVASTMTPVAAIMFIVCRR